MTAVAATKTQKPRLFAALGLALLLSLSLGACSGNAHSGYKTEINDPIEPVNRAIFAFNNVFDRFLFEPVAKIYDAVFPGFVKSGVQNFMRNLRAPIVVANNLLQGDISDAGVATARFVINTTVGVAGLVDVASTQGLTHEDEDFGQTMAVWGMGHGMYVVLPLLGPSSLRDATGKVADLAVDPVHLWSNSTHNEWVFYTRGGVEAIDNRARAIKAIEDLRKNSLDYYAAVRSAYGQRRAALARDTGRHQEAGGTVAMPDYDEEY